MFLPEWAAQSGVMLTWPHSNSPWKDCLSRVEAVYYELATEISTYEKVLIVCDPAIQIDVLKPLLTDAGAVIENIVFSVAPANDTWARDHGPVAVQTEQGIALLDYQFTGWGGKFIADKDNKINQAMANNQVWSVPLLPQQFILEGGSIETDGKGTLMTTTACLLNPNRNAGMTRAEITDRLKTDLGMEQIIWLSHGHLEGDDTDAHIDTLARFCSPDTIAYVCCDDPQDSHFTELKSMEQELMSARDINGAAYKLLPLPMAPPRFDDSNQRIPSTYANFLITNKQVLVPVYGDPCDDIALNVLQTAFPDREVKGINCNVLIEEHGSLHCITMQLPEGVI